MLSSCQLGWVSNYFFGCWLPWTFFMKTIMINIKNILFDLLQIFCFVSRKNIILFEHLEMFLFCFQKKYNIIWTFRNVFVLFSVWMLPPRQRRLLRRRSPLLSGRKQVRPREEGLLARKCESEFNQYNLFNIQTTSW
jgi:hypothetical protein